jgi:hypothetical protein
MTGGGLIMGVEAHAPGISLGRAFAALRTGQVDDRGTEGRAGADDGRTQGNPKQHVEHERMAAQRERWSAIQKNARR